MTDSQQPPYTSILLICILLKNIHKNGEGIWNVCFDEVSQNTQTEGFTTVILRGALIANAPFCRFGPKYPKWEQVKGRFKEIWSDLTDSDLGKMKDIALCVKIDL